MSKNNGNAPHGRSCRCSGCTSDYVYSTGTGFGSNNLQQGVSTTSIPPEAPSQSQAQSQVEQGRREFQALMGITQPQWAGRMWSDPSSLRAALHGGTRLTQYAYPTAIQIDLQNTSASYQGQAILYNSTNTTVVTQRYPPQSTSGNLFPPNTSVAWPGVTQNQAQTNQGSSSMYPTPSAPSGRHSSTNRTYHTSNTSRRLEEQRQSTSRPSRASRQSQSVAENTPESGNSSDSES